MSSSTGSPKSSRPPQIRTTDLDQPRPGRGGSPRNHSRSPVSRSPSPSPGSPLPRALSPRVGGPLRRNGPPSGAFLGLRLSELSPGDFLGPSRQPAGSSSSAQRSPTIPQTSPASRHVHLVPLNDADEFRSPSMHQHQPVTQPTLTTIPPTIDRSLARGTLSSANNADISQDAAPEPTALAGSIVTATSWLQRHRLPLLTRGNARSNSTSSHHRKINVRTRLALEGGGAHSIPITPFPEAATPQEPQARAIPFGASEEPSGPLPPPLPPRNTMLSGLRTLAAHIMGDERTTDLRASLTRRRTTMAPAVPLSAPPSRPASVMSSAQPSLSRPGSAFTPLTPVLPPRPTRPLAPELPPRPFATDAAPAASTEIPSRTSSPALVTKSSSGYLMAPSSASAPPPSQSSTKVSAPAPVAVPTHPHRVGFAPELGASFLTASGDQSMLLEPAAAASGQDELVVVNGVALFGRTLKMFSPKSKVRQFSASFVTNKFFKLGIMLLMAIHWLLMATRVWSKDEAKLFTLFTSIHEILLLPIFVMYTIEVVFKIIAFGAYNPPVLPTQQDADDANAPQVDTQVVLDADADILHGDQRADDDPNDNADLVDGMLRMDEAQRAGSDPERALDATAEVTPFGSILRRRRSRKVVDQEHEQHASGASTPRSLADAINSAIQLADSPSTTMAEIGMQSRPPSPVDPLAPITINNVLIADPQVPLLVQDLYDGDEADDLDYGGNDQGEFVDPVSAAATLGRMGLGGDADPGATDLETCVVVQPFFSSVFNRVDFLCVLAFWLYAIFGVSGVTGPLWVFRGLSSLRPFRFLAVTRGTRMILTSLRASRKLLRNVLVFLSVVPAAMHCAGTPVKPVRYCGGHLAQNVTELPPINGHLCPWPQECVGALPNPEDNLASFDNIGAAILVQFTVMTGENWSAFLYGLMQAESRFSALYFMVVIMILGFMLMQLFVAVIAESFSAVRAVYLAERRANHASGDTDTSSWRAQARIQSRRAINSSTWRVLFFCALVVYAGLMSFVAPMAEQRLRESLGLFRPVEVVFTTAFALETLLTALAADSFGAFLGAHPIDALLSVVTIVLLGVPFNRYLSGFLVARTYKLVTYLPPVRDLIFATKQFIGVSAVIAFMLVSLCASATTAMQMHGGMFQLSEDNPWITFNDFRSAWLAMFAGLMTGDAWPEYMWGTMKAHRDGLPAFLGPIIAAIFVLAVYSLFAYVVLNLLVCVVLDIFETEDEEKRKRQVEAVEAEKTHAAIAKQVPLSTKIRAWFALWWNWATKGTVTTSAVKMTAPNAIHGEPGGGAQHKSDMELSNIPADSTDKLTERVNQSDPALNNQASGLASKHGRLADLRPKVPPGSGTIGRNPDGSSAGGLTDSSTGNLYLNRQSLVFMSFTDGVLQPTIRRTNGRNSQDLGLRGWLLRIIQSKVFTASVFVVIILSIVSAALDTPLARLQSFRESGKSKFADFSEPFFLADVIFTSVFAFEFLLKFAAMGFDYFLSPWDLLDFSVLVTLCLSFIAEGSAAHALRMARALRPLRMISYISGAQSIFAALVLGMPRILSAVLFSMLVLFPYALFGMFLFANRLHRCNDSSVANQAKCVGLYFNTETGVWTPRVWGHVRSSFNWDSIGNSLLTLFVMASREGWTEILKLTQAIPRDPTLQAASSPAEAPAVSWWHALYSVSFMFIGSLFTLNLFVGIIVRSFDEMTGDAYLTGPQKAWNNIAKRIQSLRPLNLRTPKRTRIPLIRWVARKQRQYGRQLYSFVTVTMCVHVLLLLTEHAGQPQLLDDIKGYAFLVFVVLYLVEFLAILIPMGPRSYFLKSWWNGFDALVTTSAALFVFLVGYMLRLARRVPGLHTFFKTISASARDLSRIVMVLTILLLFFSLVFTELFGLTRFGENYSGFGSFRTFWLSFLLLFRLLTGDDWPLVMHDVKTSGPWCVDVKGSGPNAFLLTDCGSRGMAFFLFIVFFVVCTWIFLNLVIALLVANFDFVFSRSYDELVTDENLKKFRRSWACLDPRGTGRIPMGNIAALLHQLEAPFEFTVYTREEAVPRLMSIWASTHPTVLRSHHGATRGAHEEMFDFGHTAALETTPQANSALSQIIQAMDQQTIRARKRRYNLIYYDLVRQCDKGFLSFQSALMTVSLHVIPLEEYLTYAQYKERVEYLSQVHLHVARVRFAGLFKMAVQRRKFKRQLQEKMERVRRERLAADQDPSSADQPISPLSPPPGYSFA
ncbi:Ion transport protein-domain-containing protein [Catenaria anguillulae PL171]|uniref:Ion transport protein-domain-containing protein n=1 Tax=Catenaria anguillulae PL171 TaxID=765915 RepID=A0A1Y2HL45_9FUNG|nr:Ion transport protein-domain-containing protein [Catenaria anguillulae PL171]